MSEKEYRSPKKVTVLGRLPAHFPGSSNRSPSVDFSNFSSVKVLIPHNGVELNTKRANRYLIHQEQRIVKAIKEKQFDRAAFIGCLLLKRSLSYQLCLMNRTIPGGYFRFSVAEVHKFMMELRRKCAKGDLSLTLKRFYLDKGMEKTGIPNNKFRPIGSPTLISRVISKALNDMTYGINQESFVGFQHGYRVDRGTYSALFEVGKNIFVKKHTEIYEFDFKSFFNTVKPAAIYNVMSKTSDFLAETIFRVLRDIYYVYDELKPEAELQIVEIPEDKLDLKAKSANKPVLIRHGVPQGLSISPLLATLVLEKSHAPQHNLVMYADDGLIFGMNEFDQGQGFRQLKDFGICIEETKTGQVGNEFKFLGTYGNIEEKTVRYEDSILRGKDEDELDSSDKTRIKNGFKRVSSIYGAKPGKGTGEINKNSWIMNFKVNLKGMDLLNTIIAGLLRGEQFRQYRYFVGFGIFDIISSSSLCCGGFLQRGNELNAPIEEITKNRKSLRKYKKLSNEIKRMKDEDFSKYLDAIEKNRKILKELVAEIKINKTGRTLIKSDAFSVKPNSGVLFEGSQEITLINKHGKYQEGIIPQMRNPIGLVQDEGAREQFKLDPINGELEMAIANGFDPFKPYVQPENVAW